VKLPSNIVCPVCKNTFGNLAEIATGGDALVCAACTKSYPITDDIIDFRITEESSAAQGWSVDEFEKMYEGYGDWDSISEWDEKRGIPREASEYKYDRVKGRIVDMMEPKRGQSILDLGCGNGYFLLEIQRRFSPQVADLTCLGMDASKHNVMNFEAKLQSQQTTNVYPVLGTGERLPFESNSIDVVVSSEVLEHIGDKEAAIREVHRVLAPGGTFLFTTPSASALRNWDIALWPLRMIRRLSQFRLRRRGEEGSYDEPIKKEEYAAILGRAAYDEFELRSEQMLNDEIISYLPGPLLNGYISSTRFFEGKSALMRKLFGLHIIGFARK
jgi:ubiquinone/menaquinone biosynthesis C-methylase UbiE